MHLCSLGLSDEENLHYTFSNFEIRYGLWTVHQTVHLEFRHFQICQFVHTQRPIIVYIGKTDGQRQRFFAEGSSWVEQRVVPLKCTFWLEISVVKKKNSKNSKYWIPILKFIHIFVLKFTHFKDVNCNKKKTVKKKKKSAIWTNCNQMHTLQKKKFEFRERCAENIQSKLEMYTKLCGPEYRLHILTYLKI